ncbi:MAG: hypothetical protein C4K58_03175 [Flavobacteriaceae bacterium]|nr:MAG: hypothetical protein C4K58_03175 [Flavobacteriaceae bacterium]
MILRLLFLFCLTGLVSAQNKKEVPLDSISQNGEIQTKKSKFFVLEPKKDFFSTDSTRVKDPLRAMVYSAVLPGAGQAYNEKYVKAPITLGLFLGGLGYTFYQNQELNKYKEVFQASVEGREHEYSNLNLSKETWAKVRDNQQRTRDYGIAITSLVYVLNIVDAYVGANLFDLERDKDFSVYPSFDSFGAFGLSFNYNF